MNLLNIRYQNDVNLCDYIPAYIQEITLGNAVQCMHVLYSNKRAHSL